MIEALFYLTGIVFFSTTSFVIIKCYLKVFFLYNKMTESTITLPSVSTTEVNHTDVYRQRLIKARVKTEEDLQKMSDEDVKKLYLKHEQRIVEGVSDQVSKLFAKTWPKCVSKVVPIDDKEKLEEDLNKDVFLKAVINEYFPPFYYNYGIYLAPFSVFATTVSHIDYEQLTSKNDVINGTDNQKEPEEEEEWRDSAEG